MAYQKQNWEDLPSENTPILASRMNHIEDGIEEAYEHGGGGETLPVGSIIDFDGQSIPEGWQETEDEKDIYNYEEQLTNEIFTDSLGNLHPIYRKTFTGDGANATSASVSFNISDLNYDWVLEIFGMAKVQGDGFFRPIGNTSVSNVTDGVDGYVNRTEQKLYVRTGSALKLNKFYVTIKYTKVEEEENNEN